MYRYHAPYRPYFSLLFTLRTVTRCLSCTYYLGIKPFACDFCEKSYTDNYSLKQHVAKVSIVHTAIVSVTTLCPVPVIITSVPDPNPDPDPHVFGPPGFGSGSISQRYGAGSGSVYHQAKIIRKTLIPTALWLLLFDFLSLKMMSMHLQKVISKKTFKPKN